VIKTILKAYKGRLIPTNMQAVEDLEALTEGKEYVVEITHPRNLKFLKKYFGLLRAGFACWDGPEVEYKGQVLKCSFDSFRDAVTILAGYYDVQVDTFGKLKRVAKSISFAKMNEVEFEALYSATIDVILERYLTHYTRDDLEDQVNIILGFSS